MLKPHFEIPKMILRRPLLVLTTAILVACSPSETAATRGCDPTEKPCDGRCVSTTDPATGCGAAACSPCALTNASARCDAAGACSVDACALGYADCDAVAANGCEARLTDSDKSCGACGKVCTATEMCRASKCVDRDAARVSEWLATQRGGWCNAEFNQIVTLCNNTKWAPPEDEFCFDDKLLGVYPDGIEVDLGFHWDGQRKNGILFDAGGDCRVRRISLVIDADGRLHAVGPNSADDLTIDITPGTHLVTYRKTAKTSALFVDGLLVASGAGTGAEPPELVADCGPGIVLGQRISYWWEPTVEASKSWARIAPFFFHLRDVDPAADPARLSFEEATTLSARTRLLFDSTGVDGTTWNAKDGTHKGYARNGSKWAADALACLKAGK